VAQLITGIGLSFMLMAWAFDQMLFAHHPAPRRVAAKLLEGRGRRMFHAASMALFASAERPRGIVARPDLAGGALHVEVRVTDAPLLTTC
jgi:hypothetical protein